MLPPRVFIMLMMMLPASRHSSRGAREYRCRHACTPHATPARFRRALATHGGQPPRRRRAGAARLRLRAASGGLGSARAISWAVAAAGRTPPAGCSLFAAQRGMAVHTTIIFPTTRRAMRIFFFREVEISLDDAIYFYFDRWRRACRSA